MRKPDFRGWHTADVGGTFFLDEEGGSCTGVLSMDTFDAMHSDGLMSVRSDYVFR